MTIGLALAGLAAIGLAAHPRGARSLMGFMGTPEEHLAKFREYVFIATAPGIPSRQREALVERARAESFWITLSPEDQLALANAEAAAYGIKSAKSNLVVARDPAAVDPRHPPAGWEHIHIHKGSNYWQFVSLGSGRYRASLMGGTTVLTGTGNTVLSQIHGHTMDFYKTMGLGKLGARFNEQNPPAGWTR